MNEWCFSGKHVWCESGKIGEGATSKVYKGRNKITGENFAVKVFNLNAMRRSEEVQRREYDVLFKLSHKNIVKLFSVENELRTGQNVLIMELCVCSVLDMLKQPIYTFGITENEFLLIVSHLADGLKYLHEKDIVHRDVKPGNILQYINEDASHVYKLTDFGAAKELSTSNEEFTSLCGTQEYLHPDVYKSALITRSEKLKFNSSIDLWSVGITIYHIVSGRLPFVPFGGRKDKLTQYQMITMKKSGVIAGFQEIENGEIFWSKMLPNTCELSEDLKDSVTKMIAGLVESDENQRWGFDQFFKSIEEFKLYSVHVFFVPALQTYKIRLQDQDSLSNLREKVAECSGLRAEHQLLVFNGKYLTDLLNPLTSVKQLIYSTSDKPIYLFDNLFSEFPDLNFHPFQNFPKIDTSKMVPQKDYVQSKICLEITQSAFMRINEFYHNMLHVNLAFQQLVSLINMDVTLTTVHGEVYKDRIEDGNTNLQLLLKLFKTFPAKNSTKLSKDTNCLNEKHVNSENLESSFESEFGFQIEFELFVSNYNSMFQQFSSAYLFLSKNLQEQLPCWDSNIIESKCQEQNWKNRITSLKKSVIDNCNQIKQLSIIRAENFYEHKEKLFILEKKSLSKHCSKIFEITKACELYYRNVHKELTLSLQKLGEYYLSFIENRKILENTVSKHRDFSQKLIKFQDSLFESIDLKTDNSCCSSITSTFTSSQGHSKQNPVPNGLANPNLIPNGSNIPVSTLSQKKNTKLRSDLKRRENLQVFRKLKNGINELNKETEIVLDRVDVNKSLLESLNL